MTGRRIAAAATVLTLIGAPGSPAAAQPADSALTLVTGAGGAEFSGDDGPAVEARLNGPTAAAVAEDGTLYIADMVNRRVRAVSPDGIIRTVAGDGGVTPPAGPLAPGTKGVDVPLGSPNTIALGADGTLFIADSTMSRVYALAGDGTITIRVDPARLGGPINTINALTVSGDGTLYLADRENARIVEVPPGAGERPISTPAPLPASLAADGNGDVWIASASSVLSRLHDGRIATVVSPSDGRWGVDENRPNTSPFNATAVSSGRDGLYFVDNHERVVRRLGADGTVDAIADLPDDPFGRADPVNLAAGTVPDGPLYLVDTLGNRIFSTPVNSVGDDDVTEGGTPVWVWAAGGAAAVAVLVLAFWGIRRARR
ncbi:hypothetical protein [Actinoplanes sp. G11-F43]|uniref:NHL domain-containing protein n=1 Tax=Actinoplanes sp. G11-F43 TaxID=3424130 RepID=UPI003D34B84F